MRDPQIGKFVFIFQMSLNKCYFVVKIFMSRCRVLMTHQVCQRHPNLLEGAELCKRIDKRGDVHGIINVQIHSI